jgi:hypothetical protein
MQLNFATDTAFDAAHYASFLLLRVTKDALRDAVRVHGRTSGHAHAARFDVRSAVRGRLAFRDAVLAGKIPGLTGR